MPTINTQWTAWQKFNELTDDEWKKIPESPGVYQIRCVGANGKPKKIKRLLNTDSEGILGIGESGYLRTRLRAFWGSPNQHAAAWNYSVFRYDKAFPKKFLQFCYAKTGAEDKKGKNKAVELEFRLLLEYRKKFLDGPPLNVNRGKYPKTYIELFKKIIGKEPPKE
ncbi:MAG: hypothetical protein AAB356_01575 [Deltaproteobacteria bacterium]